MHVHAPARTDGAKVDARLPLPSRHQLLDFLNFGAPAHIIVSCHIR